MVQRLTVYYRMLVYLAANTASGDSQTRATLQIMQRIVRAALIDPTVVEAAVNIVRDIGGRSTVMLASRIEDWCRYHIGFLPDPLLENGGEFLRSPDLALEEIRKYGCSRLDCDDAAMLTAALSMCVGLPARFCAVAYGNTAFSHVYTQVLTSRGWFNMDVTSYGRSPVEVRAMTLEV